MRDFFYNKGDIFVAVLIILVAAFVIYLRIGVIMDYSPTGDKGGSLLPMPPSIDEVIDQITGGEAVGETAAGTEESLPNESEIGGETSTPTQTDSPQSGTAQTESPLPAENPPAQQPSQVQITVNPGDAASTIADKLLGAGAINDKQAFLSEVIAKGADSKLKTGTFTIPAGSSHADIITILIG